MLQEGEEGILLLRKFWNLTRKTRLVETRDFKDYLTMNDNDKLSSRWF